MRQCRWFVSVIALTMWVSLSSSEPLDSACVGLENTHECNDAIEAAQLPHWKQRAHRSGPTLSIVLNSGEHVKFINESGLGMKYRFRECSELAAQCVVVAGKNEYLRYITVDLATGLQSSHRGTVTYSPSGV